jgi:hypothetical protein
VGAGQATQWQEADIMLMQAGQTENTWELNGMGHHLDKYVELYILFLLIIFVVAATKLANTWRGAPPFAYLKRVLRPTYLAELRANKTSLGQWIGGTVIVWGIVISIGLGEFVMSSLSSHASVLGEFMYAMRDQTVLFTMTLVVVLALYLVRWNVMSRLEKLRG